LIFTAFFNANAQQLISLNTRLEFLTAVSNCVGSPDQCPTWGITLAPFSGKYFLGIHEMSYANSGEAISAKLNAPLVSGTAYTYSVMAAIAPITVWGGASNGDRNGVIYIYGGTASCATTQLIDSIRLFTPADRNKWRQFTFNFTATANHTHLSYFTRRVTTGGFSAFSYMVLDDAIRFDFGDAPDSYKTLLASDGARHQLFGPDLSPLIGSVVDWEEEGFPGNSLTGDDNSESTDDEDGFTSLPDLSQSQNQYSLNNIKVKNTTGKTAYLAGWIDFDRDGLFESNEAAVTVVPATGNQNVTLNWSGFVIPSQGSSHARFRISTDNSILNQQASLCKSTGLAMDGEVEDYKINFTACAPLSVSPDVIICSNDSARLQANGMASYIWSPAQGLSCADCPNPLAAPSATTTYTVSGRGGSCPISNATVTVTVIPAPKASVSPDIAICRGAQTILTASGGDAYTWSPPEGLSQTSGESVRANPINSINYTVTAIRTGCPSSAATVKVNVIYDGKADAGRDIEICRGTSVMLQGTGIADYLWSPATGLSCTNCPNPIASPQITTSYTLKSDRANCPSDPDVVTVSVLDQPTAFVDSSQTIFRGNSIIITAGGGGSYRWLSNGSTDDTLAVRPDEDSIFCVEVTGNNGCLDTACASISVIEPIVSTLWVPTSFTPNEDQHNRLFQTPGLNIVEYRASIFDRWGELIYEWSDIEKGWDGTFLGIPVQDDVFVYRIVALGADGIRYNKRGMLLILK
jgi:gliding motility-associated-like protein